MKNFSKSTEPSGKFSVTAWLDKFETVSVGLSQDEVNCEACETMQVCFHFDNSSSEYEQLALCEKCLLELMHALKARLAEMPSL